MTDSLGLGWSAWPPMAWQVAWQSTAVLALGLIGSRMMAMRPSRSHRILLTSALACLMVPPASLLARRLGVGLLPARATSVAADAGRPDSAALGPAAAAVSHPVTDRAPAAADAGPLRGTQGPAPQAARSVDRTAQAGPPGPERVLPDVPVGVAIALAWGALTIAGLLRLVASFAGG